MSSKLSDILGNVLKRDAVAFTARSFERVYDSDEAGDLELRKTAYKDLTNNYYDLVTDFYEYGWGKSFHFLLIHESPLTDALFLLVSKSDEVTTT